MFPYALPDDEWIASLDFAWIEDFLHLLDSVNIVSFFVPLVIFLYLGNKAIEERPRLCMFGARLAGLVFLAWVARTLLSEPSAVNELTELVVRSACIAGLVLGITWLLLPILAAVWHVLWHRIILAFFHLARAVLRMILGCIVWPFKAFGTLVRRRRAAREWLVNTSASEASRTAMEDARCRREDARVQCELLFQLHTHTLGERFPKAVYDDFVKRYLGDDRAPADVEQRAKQLQDAILEHVASIDPPAPAHTIESLTTWYEQTKNLINSLPVEARYKQMQLAHLNQRYVELMQKLLEGLQP